MRSVKGAGLRQLHYLRSELIILQQIQLMVIDLRSDTVTKPSPGMLDAMMKANVGDDVFGEDPCINELESQSAKMFGMEAAVFCPSGTMTNQIAIKCHTQPGDEVITDESSHVFQYEGGGIAFNSGASVKLLYGDRGRLSAAQVEAAINADDAHKARTSLVCLENTSNRGGGSCYDLSAIKEIRQVCQNRKLGLHLDGARLFNAIVRKNETPLHYGRLFDSISICLSKGLGCPVGSLLLGNGDFIRKARRIRKVFGGGMRQGGYLAAAGIYALENNIERLKEDHEHAQQIANAIAVKGFVRQVLPVETNIVIFETKDEQVAPTLANKFKEKGILSVAITPARVRFVLHLDITEEMVENAIEIISTL